MIDWPQCEIVTIGTELLLGQIEDTNTSYLAREMGKIGVEVRYRTAVGDRLEEIVHVLRNALSRCDLVITTGGLGPTLDDLTREAVAAVAGVGLEFRQDLMDQIEVMFRRAGYRMPENNRRQAFIPAGSHAIENPVGTAPAFMAVVDGKPVICLPGVPRELKHLFKTEVIPRVHDFFHMEDRKVICRILKVAGMGESKVDSLIGDLIKPGANPELGLLASIGEITIRIAALAGNHTEASSMIAPVESEIRMRLGKAVFGADEDTLEKVIEDMMEGLGKTLSIAETFSGGLAALKMYRLPSSRLVSSTVLGSRIRVEAVAGVSEATAEESASALARSVSEKAGSGLGLAIFGFLVPSGSSYSVKAAAAVHGEGIRKHFAWEMGGDIATIQQRGAMIGLNTLRLALLEALNPDSLS
jgi:nicotinamide-nucleotide amidase